jgi:hypothetical protein
LSTPEATLARLAAERQRQTNLEQIPSFELCRGHRQRLTELVLSVASSGARLCVLGAGNCYDLELAALAEQYQEIHLVDIDSDALDRAFERLPAPARSRIVRHSPVDLSGMLPDLERWRQNAVSLEEVLALPARAAASVEASVGGRFDVVLSACLLTQMQLSILEALSDTHPLFAAARETLNLTHIRTLSRLLSPSGIALCATDVTSNHTAPLAELDPNQDLRPLFEHYVAENNVFHAVHPLRWPTLVRDDPVLNAEVVVSKPLAVWLWQNSPTLFFLVYVFALRRMPSVAAHPGQPVR